MKKSLLAIAALLTTVGAFAQISITSSTLNYTQNFNTLSDTGITQSAMPMGWGIAELGNSGNTTYRAGAGYSNTGDTYSFGDSMSTERALGSLSSGSVLAQFGATFQNNTGSKLDSVRLTFNLEQWRTGDTTNRTDTSVFWYSTTAADLYDSTAGAWMPMTGFDLYSITTNVPGPMNGNLAANKRTITGHIPLSIANGGKLLIKWYDRNITGSDDGLAIDDFNATFYTGTTSIKISTTASTQLKVLGQASSGSIAVRYSALSNGKATFVLYDVNGQRVMQYETQATKGINQATLTTPQIPAGVYMLQLSTGVQQETVRFSVQ